MRLLRNRKGMTLVEVVISTLLVTMISTALVATLVHSLRGWSSGASQEVATGAATLALQKLCNEIRTGRSAVASTGTLTVTYPRSMTDAGTGEVIFDLSANDPLTNTYYVSGGRLVRSRGGVVTSICPGVNTASFVVRGGIVEIDLDSNEKLGSVGATQHVSGRAAMRNYRT